MNIPTRHEPEDQAEAEGRPSLPGRYVPVIPLILVNVVAISGQLAFLREHLRWGLPGDLVFAGALEAIAVYLAYHAHVALLGNDSALRLRLASYVFGAVIGAMNFSHYAGPHLRPTFEAVAVGLMSASSPWLWGIHSRRQSRALLLAKGLIEPHALRLGPTRWLWHPLRSVRVMWFATWAGIQSPAEAIAAAGLSTSAQSGDQAGPAAQPGTDAPASPELPPVPTRGELAAMSKAEAIRIALAHNSGIVLDAQRWLAARGVQADRAYMHDVKRGVSGKRRSKSAPPAPTAQLAPVTRIPRAVGDLAGTEAN